MCASLTVSVHVFACKLLLLIAWYFDLKSQASFDWKPRFFFPRFWVFSYIFLFNFWNRKLLENMILWFVDWWFILLDFTVNFCFFLILASQIFCFSTQKILLLGVGEKGMIDKHAIFLIFTSRSLSDIREFYQHSQILWDYFQCNSEWTYESFFESFTAFCRQMQPFSSQPLLDFQ